MSDILECLVASLRQPGTMPRYLMIADALEQAIRRHQLAEGTFLPTERLMAEKLGLSRVTISKAMAELERTADHPPARPRNTRRAGFPLLAQ
ncbi:GntR family transcriptional regulator [Chromobacterium haemolyticum]|nr:GntR family transcriptional regulator [Chromobacterium haemolyticum]